MLEVQAGRWEAAERALKSALMYEPANARFKEQLAQVQAEIEKTRPKGDYRSARHEDRPACRRDGAASAVSDEHHPATRSFR
jgi:hypothetical protein